MNPENLRLEKRHVSLCGQLSEFPFFMKLSEEGRRFRRSKFNISCDLSSESEATDRCCSRSMKSVKSQSNKKTLRSRFDWGGNPDVGRCDEVSRGVIGAVLIDRWRGLGQIKASVGLKSLWKVCEVLFHRCITSVSAVFSTKVIFLVWLVWVVLFSTFSAL